MLQEEDIVVFLEMLASNGFAEDAKERARQLRDAFGLFRGAKGQATVLFDVSGEAIAVSGVGLDDPIESFQRIKLDRYTILTEP